MKEFLRTEMLLGSSAVEKLKNSRVAIFGVGGVGGYVAEALARSGVGSLMLVDNDKVSPSNINRQIIALHSTVGEYKVDVLEKRLKDINPNIEVVTKKIFYLPENADEIPLDFDYVADAVDTVTAKIELISRANKSGVKIISSMGTGNKVNPLKFKIADIEKTSGCPLARVMRKELKNRGISGVKVVYSDETPTLLTNVEENCVVEKRTPSSIVFMPAIAGLLMASEIIKDLTKDV